MTHSGEQLYKCIYSVKMFDTTFITVPSGSTTLRHGSQRESSSTQLTVGKFIYTVQCGIATFLHIATEPTM